MLVFIVILFLIAKLIFTFEIDVSLKILIITLKEFFSNKIFNICTLRNAFIMFLNACPYMSNK